MSISLYFELLIIRNKTSSRDTTVCLTGTLFLNTYIYIMNIQPHGMYNRKKPVHICTYFKLYVLGDFNITSYLPPKASGYD